LSQRARIAAVPEYLAPGVYVEEISYRSKAIDGVPTSVGALVLGIFLGVAAAIAVDRARRRRRLTRVGDASIRSRR
jgi:phage tail sheath protein FI